MNYCKFHTKGILPQTDVPGCQRQLMGFSTLETKKRSSGTKRAGSQPTKRGPICRASTTLQTHITPSCPGPPRCPRPAPRPRLHRNQPHQKPFQQVELRLPQRLRSSQPRAPGTTCTEASCFRPVEFRQSSRGDSQLGGPWQYIHCPCLQSKREFIHNSKAAIRYRAVWAPRWGQGGQGTRQHSPCWRGGQTGSPQTSLQLSLCPHNMLPSLHLEKGLVNA